MLKHPATPFAILLALALALSGCDLGTDPGEGLGGLEPAATELALSDLLVPLQALIEPGQLLRQAVDSLSDRGVAFSTRPAEDGRLPAPPVGPKERLRSMSSFVGAEPLSGTARVELPPEVRGQTFVWDDDGGGWVPDPDRTGAPDEGIRIIWYTTDPSFDVIVPLEEQGHMDLTDQDTATLSRLGLVVTATTRSAETVLADLTQAYDTATTTGSEYIETRGLYSDGSEEITFDITLDGTEDASTGDSDLAFHAAISTPAVSYTLDQVGTITASSGNSDQLVTATVVREGMTTTLELDVTVLETGSQSGSGTLSHDGTAIAEITIDGQRFTYRGAGGRELTDSQKNQLDNLVRTLQATGILVFFNLPLLFG